MKGSDGQRADSHGGLIAQQHGEYPLPGLHTDTPTCSVPYAPTVRVPCPTILPFMATHIHMQRSIMRVSKS